MFRILLTWLIQFTIKLINFQIYTSFEKKLCIYAQSLMQIAVKNIVENGLKLTVNKSKFIIFEAPYTETNQLQICLNADFI